MDRLASDRMFVAVMEGGSFAIAARRLGVSSGQASKLVADLERRLGVQLLKRTTRALSPTETGTAYFERMRAILGELDALDAAVQAGTGEVTGKLRLTVSSSFGESRLAPLLFDFLCAHPRIELDIGFTDRIVAVVEEGYDAAIRIGAVSDTSLIARRLSQTRVTLAAAPAYLALHGRPEVPADLARHACILDQNFRDVRRWQFRDPESGAPLIVDVSGRLSASSGRACILAAERGLGIAYAPSFMSGQAFAEGRLVPLLTAYEHPPLPIAILYPPTKHLAPKLRALIDFLADRLKGAPAWEQGWS